MNEETKFVSFSGTSMDENDSNIGFPGQYKNHDESLAKSAFALVEASKKCFSKNIYQNLYLLADMVNCFNSLWIEQLEQEYREVTGKRTPGRNRTSRLRKKREKMLRTWYDKQYPI